MSRRARECTGVTVMVAGLLAATPSVRQTVQHITDETYLVPEAREGAGHVQYHLAREALITAGAATTIGLGLLAGPRRGPSCWRGMAATTAGFVAAMWSGGPVNGTWAPNRAALIVHAASTSALTAGLLLLRPKATS